MNIESRPVNISFRNIPDNMTQSVSNLSNAELDILLKEILGDAAPMNDRVYTLDQPGDDLTHSLMDTDNVTDAEDKATTLLEKVMMLESQLSKAVSKIYQLTDRITDLEKENEAHRRESCTKCDKVKAPVTDVTNQNRPEHDEAFVKVDNQRNKIMSGERSKCRIENRGKCRRKNCNFIHPTMTCQTYSSTGSCNNENRCEHRHPKTVCYAWQSYRECKHGEHCRHRHPVHASAVQCPNPFLWGGYTDHRQNTEQRMLWNSNQVYQSNQNRGF